MKSPDTGVIEWAWVSV